MNLRFFPRKLTPHPPQLAAKEQIVVYLANQKVIFDGFSKRLKLMSPLNFSLNENFNFRLHQQPFLVLLITNMVKKFCKSL